MIKIAHIRPILFTQLAHIKTPKYAIVKVKLAT